MWVYTLLPKILNMSLTGGIVIIFVLITRILLKKAPKIFSYALWAVVLFRLVCPVSFSTGFSLIGLFNVPAATNGSITYIPDNIVHTEYPQVTLPFPGISKVINDSFAQGEEQLAADPLEAPVALASLLWLLGIAIMLIYSTISLMLLHRKKLIGSVRLRDNIYLADHIATPFVIGVIRPKIYLPSSLTEQEHSYVILHEQTHIRRFDHIFKLIAFIVLAVHWFNPLVWAAFVCCIKDMEMSCDESVLKEMGDDIKAAYSTSLLSLAAGRHLINGSPLAFGEGNIKERIKNVIKFKKPGAWAVAVSVLLVTVLSIGFASNKAADETEPERLSNLNTVSSPQNKGKSDNSITNDNLRKLAQKGNKLTFEDFAAYEGGDASSNFNYHIMVYSVEGGYRLIVRSDGKQIDSANLERIWDSGGSGIDIRYKDVEEFIKTHPSSEKTNLEPASPELSSDQVIGADMAELDYASDDIVIFHGYFGLFVYDLNSNKMIRSLDLNQIGCAATQGDNYCEVTVSADGNTVQLHPMSSKNMYVYTVSDNTLQKTDYKRMENRFTGFVDTVDIVGYQKAGSYSHTAVRFDTGEYGYLHTADWTLGTLTYVRGGDISYRLFGFGESSSTSSLE